MGYFSNGTEADIYQDAICMGCFNYSSDELCSVLFVHELFIYSEEPETTDILNMLIPRIDGQNDVCSMFAAIDTPSQEHADEWHARILEAIR